MVNVAARLKQFEPQRSAVIVAASGRLLTFGELDARSDALAAGLVNLGLRGQRVAVMAPPSLDFFTLVFALFKAGVVPVMVDPGMGIKNLGRCLQEADVAAFIGVPKAHVARRLFGWCKGAITINVGNCRYFCQHSTAGLMTAKPIALPTTNAENIAAILFTSGSTGLAKGVEYTHGIFDAQVKMLKSIYGIEPGEVDLCTFPLFALFGPALGMTCVIPTMNFTKPATIDAKRTVAAIEKYRVTNLFGSPAVIRRLVFAAEPLPTLRRAISAGAPARLVDVRAFAALISSGQLFTPYGATECLPVANIGSDELLTTRTLTETGHGICIGRPVPGVSVSIIPIRDDVVETFDVSTCLLPGEVGEIVVRGPTVTKRYWKREDATRLAKMHDPATGETLHRMGDLGYFDAQGRLWFCGRKSHRVGSLYTDQVEPIFNTLLGVFRTALVGVKDTPVVCVEPVSFRNAGREYRWRKVTLEPSDPRTILDDLNRLRDQSPRLSNIRTFLFHPGFPMDPRHNSKINREKLAAWAAKKLAASS